MQCASLSLPPVCWLITPARSKGIQCVPLTPLTCLKSCLSSWRDTTAPGQILPATGNTVHGHFAPKKPATVP